MATHNSGTALLVVILLSGLMASLGLLIIKSSIWGDSLDQAVYHQEKHYQYAQGLLDCGIARAMQEFDAICKAKKHLMGSINDVQFAGTVSIIPQGDIIRVTSTISCNGTATYTISAQLAKDEHSLVTIRCFQR
jgi:hypothetical protein